MELIKREISDRLIRIYLVQLMEEDFRFSLIIKNELKSLLGELNTVNLNTLSFDQIRTILGQHFVDEVYYFSTREMDIWIENFDLGHFIFNNNKIIPPRIFSNIKQESSDSGGLMVLELYNTQLYELYAKDGEYLLETCSDLELGANGQIYYRLISSVFWEKAQVKRQVEVMEDFDLTISDGHHYNFFPNIYDRDRRSENCLFGDNLDEKIITPSHFENNAAQNPDSLRYLVPLYENNPELARIAVRHNPLYFSLLSISLQCDHTFVISVLRESANPKIIFNFLIDRFKQDPDIRIIPYPEETQTEQSIHDNDDDLPF